jgi:hypothetical protein
MSEIFEWAPTSISYDQFWSMLGVIAATNPDGLAGVTGLTYKGATMREGVDLRSCPALRVFTASRLATMTGNASMNLFDCPVLATVSMPLLATAVNLHLEQLPAIDSIDLPSLASAQTFYVQQDDILVALFLRSLTTFSSQLSITLNPLLTHVDLSRLATAGDSFLIIRQNASLESLTFPALTRIACTVDVSQNALTAASVNSILVTLAAATTDGVTPWALSADLSGGTNAAPTGPGVAALATLIGRGATITTN